MILTEKLISQTHLFRGTIGNEVTLAELDLANPNVWGDEKVGRSIIIPFFILIFLFSYQS